MSWSVVLQNQAGDDYPSTRRLSSPEAAAFYARALAEDPAIYLPHIDPAAEAILIESEGPSESPELCRELLGLPADLRLGRLVVQKIEE